MNATESPEYARRDTSFIDRPESCCQERSDRKRHEHFDYHLDAPVPRYNCSGTFRSADILASDRTRAAGIRLDCTNVLAAETRRFGEIMNKYLSIEEQRAFWTDLFTVTIHYEQRHCAATETSPDSSGRIASGGSKDCRSFRPDRSASLRAERNPGSADENTPLLRN